MCFFYVLNCPFLHFSNCLPVDSSLLNVLIHCYPEKYQKMRAWIKNKASFCSYVSIINETKMASIELIILKWAMFVNISFVTKTLWTTTGHL